jgi:peptidoglycan/LPS O-acetylase OafA/YrhL
MSSGTFSFYRFYERRARRLLPALFVVLIVCLPFAWQWMLAKEMTNFSASLFSTATFLSNFYFLSQVDYFAANAEMQPLLHTWSLAVEEQYYLLFPPVLLVVYNLWKMKAAWLVATVTILSFFIAEYALYAGAERSFFFTGSRIWEIGVGSLTAFLIIKRGVVSNNGLALLGLVAIWITFIFYDKSTPFPGRYALLPVIGTALIILYAGEGTWVARLLSMRVFVGIGLVSYSAYLWHQPLFAFARLRLVHEPSWQLMLILSLFTLLLAALSWRFIEQPFRGSSPLFPKRIHVYLASGFGLLFFSAIGVWGYSAKGYPERLPSNVSILEGMTRLNNVSCTKQDSNICITGAAGKEYNTIMFGDSHANTYASGFHPYLENSDKAIGLVNGGCAPIINFMKYNTSKRDAECSRMMSEELLRVSNNNQITTVILAAQWSYYIHGWRNGSRKYAYRYGTSSNTSGSQNPNEFKQAFLNTIDVLKKSGKKIFIIGPLPEYSLRPPEALAKIEWHGGSEVSLLIPLEDYHKRNKVFSELMGMKESHSVNFINVAQNFCNDEVCWPYSNREGSIVPLYSDGNHLNAHGLDGVTKEILMEIQLLQ